MSDTSILITALGVQPLLFALGWWLVAMRLSTEQEALRHWAQFSFVGGLSMLLFHPQVAQALGAAAVLVRNAGLVLAFVLLRRGLLAFCRQPRRDREQASLWVAGVALMVLLGTSPHWLDERTAVLSALLAWLLLRSAVELRRGGVAEFGAAVVNVVSLPLAVFGLGMAARAAHAIASVTQRSIDTAAITQADVANVMLLLKVLVLVAVFHFALGYLVLVRMVAQLKHLSDHDSLTRLLNRRAFEERLAEELARNRRTGEPLALLMVDVDHFKRINDGFGHAVGDAALRAVAERLSEGARATDAVGRLGGEEFAVLLPGSDAAGVAPAAERFRALVGGQPLAAVEGGLAVTVSVGASVLLGRGDDADALLRRADQALYRAKAEGRNRVVVHAPGPAAAGEPSAPLGRGEQPSA